MRRSVYVLIAGMFILTACSSNSEPTAEPVETVTVTETQTPAPSPEPVPVSDVRTVGDCAIEPRTNCRGDDLTGARLHGAEIQHSNFDKADFTDADLRQTNFRGSLMKGATFTDADMEGVKLEGVDLTGATFAGANLTHANFIGATMTNADFGDAVLCHTVLTNGTTDDSGCPTPSPSPTQPDSGAPVIQSLSGTVRGDCVATRSTGVTLSYSTSGATEWVLKANGAIIEPNAPSGEGGTSYKAELYCKGRPWTITLVASNANGSSNKSFTLAPSDGE